MMLLNVRCIYDNCLLIYTSPLLRNHSDLTYFVRLDLNWFKEGDYTTDSGIEFNVLTALTVKKLDLSDRLERL